MISNANSRTISADDIADLYYRLYRQVLRVPVHPIQVQRGALCHARHFERAARLLQESGANPVLWIRAQLELLRERARPNTLASKQAGARFKVYMDAESRRHENPEARCRHLDMLATPPDDPVRRALADYGHSKAKVDQLLEAETMFPDRNFVIASNHHVLSPAYLVRVPWILSGYRDGTLDEALKTRIDYYFAPMLPDEIGRFHAILAGDTP